MNTHDTKTELLRRGDVTELLRLADKYMEVYRTDGKRFELPENHKFLEPVVKYYARRANGFAKYILNMRDEFPKKHAEHVSLNKLYRTVFTRAVQQQRRARADNAIKKAIAAHGEPPSFSERLAWIARREAQWAAERIAFLDSARAKAGGKLSRDESNQMLEGFWAEVDAQIEQKGVPPWNQ